MPEPVVHIPVFKCRVKGCPWPKDAEVHVPWCLHIPRDHGFGVTHQHIPKKGMGGNNPESKIRAILCGACHDFVDNTPHWDNCVTPGVDG
ncbi:hypothetical protein LCGC14_3062260, partial [marine sediment metagenome]